MNSKTLTYSALKPMAVELRKSGKTFSEIQQEIGKIPKSTLSTWLKNIELTKEQTARINEISKQNGSIGRQIGARMNHQKRIDRLAAIREIAVGEYIHFTDEPTFAAGLVLYLAEGSKKNESFQFMNSDYKLVKYMTAWAETFGNIKPGDMRFRLYIHELYKHEDCEDFWQEKLRIRQSQMLKTIYKPNIREYKKNPDYKGCIRFEVRGSELYWKTMVWRDCFYDTIL